MFAPLNHSVREIATELASRSRRGTVLLLVLGALAMVLVLAVVYAALGKGDRRNAQTVVARNDIIASRDGHAQHIIDTIMKDVFDLTPEVAMEEALVVLGRNTPIMRRETVDMPYTDFHYVSVPSVFGGGLSDQTAIDGLRFRPSGGHSADIIWDRDFASLLSTLADITGIDNDPRVASDPWLASTRPVDLGGGLLGLDEPMYLRQRDWLQISNFAPDGRFVNLFYLRGDQDGFDAPSIDFTRDPNGDNPRLSLMDRDGNPTRFLPFNDMLTSGSTLGRRVEADWNRPAHWTMHQRDMFRPINDDFARNGMADPGNREYFAYQYADADGDGFLDSRWIELIDFSDDGRPTAILGDSDYRFFMAVRAIDLSSLANVTTATDFLTPPTSSTRLGSGAHETNLFKLFHETEQGMSHSTGDILGYNSAFTTNTGQAGDYQFYDDEIAKKLGRKAYLRLISGSIRGRGFDYGQVPGEENPGNILSDMLEDYTPFMTSEERLAYANSIGNVYPGSAGGGNSRTSPYGIGDLVELLTFHGINDDQNFSLLEQALSSDNDDDNPLSYSMLRSDRSTALDAWPAATGNSLEIKLLRSAVDVRRMLTTVSGHRPLRSSILEAANFAHLTEDVDRKIWLDGLVLGDGDYENDFDGDTIDGLNEERSELLANTFGVYMELLAPNLAQVDWVQVEPNFDVTKTQYYGHMGPELAVRLAGHMALNFRDMADMPYIDLNDENNTGKPNGVPDYPSVLNLNLNDPVIKTQYGLRQDTPTAAVMRLSDRWTPLTGGTDDIMDELWAAGLKLDVEELYRGKGYDLNTDVEHIALSGFENVSHDAMIMYGVEPQPFLSQVSSMTMYTDVSHGDDDRHDGTANAEGEWLRSSILGGPNLNPGDEDDYDGLPNIKGDVEDANTDFLFQALFFQIFNPFDVPIVLDDYYIEFADSFYNVGGGAGGSVVLSPLSTVVLWVSNPGDPAMVDARLRTANAIPPIGSSGISEFERMIIAQTGLARNESLIQIKTRYAKPPTGTLGGSGSYDIVQPGDVVDFFHGTPGATSDANRAVMLWRDNPDYVDPALGRIDWTMGPLVMDNRSTDQLVDRLRDTSDIKVSAAISNTAPPRAALDRRLDLPTRSGPNGELTTINDAIRGHTFHRAAPDDVMASSSWTNYNELGVQLGVALWGNISRKDDSKFDTGRSSVDYYTANALGGALTGLKGNREIQGTPIGALPAKVFEPTFQNPSGTFDAFEESPFLEHVIDVSGDGQDVLPEDLYLLKDFLETGPSPTPVEKYQTHPNVVTLWRSLLDGTENAELFDGLGTEVFNRAATVTLGAEIEASDVTDFGEYAENNYISITVNQNEFRDFLTGRRSLRVGDMLLPLAVGGYRTPLEEGPGTTPAPASADGTYSLDPNVRIMQYEAQWTTLGEALAAAAGYSDSVGPETTRVAAGVDDPFTDLSFEFDSAQGKNIAKQDAYVLDRAHLRLDAFAPFMDLGDGSPGTPNGTFDEGSDIRRGLGIPMALAIFDMAQAGSETGFVAKGSIDRPVMGTININTADAEILRLSPALAMDIFDSRTANVDESHRLWWPATLFQTSANDTAYRFNAFETRKLTDPTDPTSRPVPIFEADVGSTIVDYREAARTTRFVSPSRLPGGTVATTEVADATLGYVDPGEEERGLRIDRRLSSGMSGIRSQPGIGSMGELFAARNVINVPTDPENPALNNPHLDNQHHMDGFARNNRTSGVGFIDRRAPQNNANYGRGMDEPREPLDFVRNGGLSMEIASFGEPVTGDLISASYAMDLLTNPNLVQNDIIDMFPGSYGADGDPLTLDDNSPLLPIMPDQIPDDYDEQLIQLNAVLNSMSVGSDYYAVWFVLHGYRESDTLDLGPQDPLTPSFKGRYLMILDRSNVTSKGDQPRVLAFVQVPESLPPAP